MFLISMNINVARKKGKAVEQGEEKCKRNLEELFKGAISSESLFFAVLPRLVNWRVYEERQAAEGLHFKT